MKHMLTMQRTTSGFALPTILIASVVMLIVLLSAVTAVTSSSSLLSNQYYNELAREAAESGLANAKYCLSIANYNPSWTDALPLKPDKDCNGAALGAGYSQWIVNNGNIRSTFTVLRPAAASAGSLRIVSTGTVQLVRGSNAAQVWRTYTATTAQISRYNDAPQIAGGAGWKTVGTPGYSGHNGYMLASTGVLYGWGDNSGNQLGDNTLGVTVSKPIKIVLPDGVLKARKVFNSGQGASILCIIGTHNTLGDQAYCRGSGGLGGATWQRFGLSGSLTATDMVVNGYDSDGACVLASDAQVYCAGTNDAGGLGTTTGSDVAIPMNAPTKFRLDLANPGPISGSAASLTVKKVFSQDRTTCVIASDDQAYCAGDNSDGQLGHGNFTTNVWIGKSTPGRALIPGAPVVADVRLTYHGAQEGIWFQTAAGDIFMSGRNSEGTAADGFYNGSCANGNPTFRCYSTPRQMTSGVYSQMFSIGERGDDKHSFCVIQDGTIAANLSGLYCIGANTYGQVGNSACAASPPVYASWYGSVPMANQRALTPINIEADYQMNSLMVITALGDVYAAGDNTYGKLGRGTSGVACNSTYAKVLLPAGVKATALANGDEYTAFILGDNGRVYSMGRNNNGQLGDGTTIDRSTPVEVQIPRQETVY
jgi:alpha-tubulin suppressor-like RCC1 family protein